MVETQETPKGENRAPNSEKDLRFSTVSYLCLPGSRRSSVQPRRMRHVMPMGSLATMVGEAARLVTVCKLYPKHGSGGLILGGGAGRGSMYS